jgi:hypothetical protein
MLDTKRCPPWVGEWYTFLVAYFDMGAWNIEVAMVNEIKGELRNAGRCTSNHPYLYAYIELARPHVKREPDRYVIAFHEFLHILTGGNWSIVCLLMRMVGREKEEWGDAWDALNEPDIERLARKMTPLLLREMREQTAR